VIDMWGRRADKLKESGDESKTVVDQVEIR